MTEHLPECLALLNDDCICDALRACEERVLDAARDAVDEMDLHGCHPYRFADCNCIGPQVIAAIYAVREKQ